MTPSEKAVLRVMARRQDSTSWTRHHLATATKYVYTLSAISTALTRLRDKGLVYSPERGWWRVTREGREFEVGE